MDGEDSRGLPLIIIAGPTGVGKTELGIRVAEALHGEIVSADSAAVYRGLDVGTAKPSSWDRGRIVHHLIDVVDPQWPFSVADFQRLAKDVIFDIQARGRLPIIVGGTGLWIRALVRNYELPKEAEPSDLRLHLETLGAKYGFDSLARQLRVVDPASYAAIHANDHRRLIRAMEVFQTTGKRLARSPAPKSPFLPTYWVLTRTVGELQARIVSRCRSMLDAGLVTEVRQLLDEGVRPGSQSLTSIGYRETIDYLFGRTTADERDELIIRHTQQLARRQLTWFRSEKAARWLDLSTWSIEEAVRKITGAMPTSDHR